LADLLARDDLAGSTRQQMEKLERLRFEPDRSTIPQELRGFHVELERAETDE
jgi:hypothetical protein